MAAAGALAAVAAIALSVIAARLNDGRAVLLGLRVLGDGGAAGLPRAGDAGRLIGDNGLVQAAGALNIPLGGADPGRLGAARAAPPAQRRGACCGSSSRCSRRSIASATLALLFPALHPRDPALRQRRRRSSSSSPAAAAGLLAWRAGRTFLLTRRTSDLLVTIGVVWLVGREYGLLDSG